jgi:hypothetical protein
MRTVALVVAALFFSLGIPRPAAAQQLERPPFTLTPPNTNKLVVPFVVPPLAVEPKVVCGMTILSAPTVDPKFAKEASKDPKPVITVVQPKECTSRQSQVILPAPPRK